MLRLRPGPRLVSRACLPPRRGLASSAPVRPAPGPERRRAHRPDTARPAA
jgi:hypothetical protein